MAAVLDSQLQRCMAALSGFSSQEACSALGIRENVRGLLSTLARIDAVVAAHDGRRILLSSQLDPWVAQVKDAVYEVDDVLDVCAVEGAKALADADHPPAAPKVRCAFIMFSCFRASPSPAKFHHDIGFTIRDIDIRLRDIDLPALPAGGSSSTNRRDCFIISNSDEMLRCGNDAAVGTQLQKAVSGLVPRMLREGKKKVDVFAIVGAVGIGKTTLARAVFADERTAENFPIRVWVKMSKDMSEVAFLKKIIAGAGVNVVGDAEKEDKEELLGLLGSALSKRFLIVLDDLHSPGIWDDLLKDPLGDGVARGRVLVTTRDEGVATGLKAVVHRVDRMDAENSWALLRQQVFVTESSSSDLQTLEDVGTKIAEKCQGHPLAIKVMAGVLRARVASKAEWETVLHSDAWSMRPLLPQVPQALYLGYVDLPSELKECFLHCSLYPEECPIRRFDLVRRWIAEGLVKASSGENKELEESAEEYYLQLIGRNLLQPDPGNLDQCWITHDLLRSLARFLITDESILIDGQQRSSSLSSSLSKPRHLALCNMEENGALEGPISVKQQMSLRSLMLFNSPNVRVIDDLIVSAPCLRVLDLSNTAVEALPKSIGNLLHLRYLNLDGTQVRDIPSSVGFLINLQTLSLQGCQGLQKLPWSISALQELRCLCLEGTSLRYVPRGVSELRHLNHLSGLIIGHDSSNDPEGCDLDDLKALSELRYLHIERIDRATTSGAAALANKPFLKVLHLSEQPPLIEEEEEHEEETQEGAEKEEDEINNQRNKDDAAKASEKIWNELAPPQSVERLVIKNYQGRKFPNWMAGPKLSTSFPGLVFLDLDNCTSCTTLPALGRLNQLKSLQISNADSVLTIGSEFLGATVLSQTTSFPKLEVLKLTNMKKLEDWSLSVEENQIMLPCLKSLHIHFCPKLKALPEGLKHAAALCDLRVEGAHALTEIKDLPILSDELYLKDNRALLKISNLPVLQSLTIDDCSKLKHVSGLDTLQHLKLVFPPSTETFYFEELVIFWSIAFPRWLEVLIRKHNGLRRFELQCTLPLLRSCLDGGKNWHVVQQIPEVRITSTDGKKYIRYNKGRRIYETNAQSSEDS